ncbi:MAG: TonB-dependent receptor plug domain-containing protein, partial [Prolixibacteraceae bacterium]|nr:TonB-dependent receptor plug domain-containing protein [Prolixibacteraceae bacterium]
LYLCGSLIMSFVFPLITFTVRREIDFSQLLAIPSSASVNVENMAVVESATVAPQMDIGQIAALLLVAVIFVCLLRLLAGHVKVLRLLRKCRKTEINRVAVYVSKSSIRPFAFFNKIVLPESLLDNSILPLILQHEGVHVQKRHWLDNLFIELANSAQWFNPFMWLMRRDLKNNLEFQTDNEIIKENDAQHYQLALLQLVDNRSFTPPFLTALNNSGLKTRIKMMKMKKESKNPVLRKLVIVPLGVALLIGLSNREFKAAVDYGDPTSLLQANAGEVLDADSFADVKESSFWTDHNENNDGSQFFYINGKEVSLEKLRELQLGEIESFSILKGESAVAVYGEKVKNGAVLIITTKNTSDPEINSAVDAGKERINIAWGSAAKLASQLEVAENDTSNTVFLRMKRDASGNGDTIIIKEDTTAANFFTRYTRGIDSAGNNDLLIEIDGKQADKNQLATLKPDEIESFSILKGESAVAVYGENGKNGVILITKKNSTKITTEEELSKFLRDNFRYSPVAAESKLQGKLSVYINTDDKGNVANVKWEAPKDKTVDLEEVIVVAFGSRTNDETDGEKNQAITESSPLVQEAMRVARKIPTLDIDKYKNKWLKMNVNFVLQ